MKRLRPIAIALIILAAASASVFAQKKSKKSSTEAAPCPVQRAPGMRGFSLGMHLTEVKGALEDASMFDSKISVGNSVGSRAIRIQGSELKGDNAEGVDDVDLVFVDDRLASVKVNFNSAMRWDNAQDFFTRMSESLGLPKPVDTEQAASSQRNQKYVFECTAFSVTLAYAFGVSPSVAIADVLALKGVGQRREKTDEGEIREIRINPGRPPRQP